MKRLWLSAAILMTMFAAALGNSRYLNGLVADFSQTLSSAHNSAKQGNWEAARQMTGQAAEHWQEHGFYLHVILPHRDIDDIHLIFRELEEYLRLEEADQYTAANAKLIAQLCLLAEMEQLSWKNIL